MNIFPMEGDRCGSGAEGFVVQFAFHLPINGIRKVRPEALNIEEIGTTTDFFIGREPNLDCSMGNLRMLHQVFH